MSVALFTYGDWIRHEASGKVAVLCTADLKNYLATVKYADGRIEQLTIFDYDFIMEDEYYRQVDPSRCGPPMLSVADSYNIALNMQEDWFTGGLMKSGFVIKGEDWFK